MKQFLKRKFRRFVKRFVSYAIRLKLVFYLKIKKIDNVIAFHTVFSELDNSKVVNYFLPKFEHRYQLSNREYLLLEIIKRMNKMGHIYTPVPIFYGDSSLIEKIKSQSSLIVTSIHNGFAFTTKFINSLDRKVATIAAHSIYVKDVVFKRTGISSEVKVIERDKFCLVKLIDAVKSCNVICCDIDFQKSTREKFIYVSPGLFIFAHKKNLPLYFARYEISSSGGIEILFKESDCSKTSEEKLIDFIDFVNSSRVIKRTLLPSKY